VKWKGGYPRSEIGLQKKKGIVKGNKFANP
jgi:hypothetical protein